jgi:hypothetical protein
MAESSAEVRPGSELEEGAISLCWLGEMRNTSFGELIFNSVLFK